MKLSELRRLAIRKQMRVRFALANGTECLITESGLAQVPSLKEVPDFNLEAMLPGVETFRVEMVGQAKTDKPQVNSRDQMEKLIASLNPANAVATHDHDE